MSALLLAVLLQAAREEVVDVPGEALKIPLVHVPVGGTSLSPYALAKHETTWNDFHAFLGEDLGARRNLDGLTRPSIGHLSYLGQLACPEGFLEAGRPVIAASWHTAMAYCDWLTAKTGRKFRLPTNAEWEHAARAGEKGEGTDGGWHKGNSGGQTRKPGMGAPNAWGLHDMLGNVREPVLEPAEPGSLAPVWRGGAWNSTTSFAARQLVPAEWYLADPHRPRSLWWWTGGFCQGLRVACVGDLKASAAYLPKITTKVLKDVEKRVPPTPEARAQGAGGSQYFRRLSVEVTNGGPSKVLELELKVHYLTPEGAPHPVDVEGVGPPGRPTCAWTYPAPLEAGETRTVEVDVPETTDDEALVNTKAFGATATWVRLALTK